MIVTLLIGLILFCLAFWVLRTLGTPNLPSIVTQILYVVLVVVFVVWLIGTLTGRHYLGF